MTTLSNETLAPIPVINNLSQLPQEKSSLPSPLIAGARGETIIARVPGAGSGMTLSFLGI
jgi:hypothetical protein